jgi:hypothetical protein
LPPRPNGGSTEPSTAEETLVRSVLLDIGSLALFRCIGMMFMLDQLVIRDLFSRVASVIVFAPIGGRNGWHMGRHNEILVFQTKPQAHKVARMGKLSCRVKNHLQWTAPH